MSQTTEKLEQENKRLQERIEELEKIQKEHDDAVYKKTHDRWVGKSRGRGFRK